MTTAIDSDPLSGNFVASSDRRLKVVLASWAPFHAGAEVAAVRLATGLRDDGHDVTVLLGTEGETFQQLQKLGIVARHIPFALTDKLRWWRYHRAQREVGRVLQEVQPDVVHANDLPTSQMVGETAGQLGIPRVCHHRWVFGGSAIDWLNKFSAERHLFVSHALKDELCAASDQLAAAPVAVVHDGLPIPVVASEDDRRNLRRKLGLADDRLLVLFAGQIIERKGVGELIHAWRLLAPVWSTHANLVIVGEDLENGGNYRQTMESLARELGLQACVQFVGFQKNVAEWIVGADVCVVPSHVEPLGFAVLEAMAQSRPVIASNVGGIPELIIDRETGMLLPPRNVPRLAGAIETLLRDSALRTRLGRAARSRCEENFSIQTHVRAIVDIYRHLVPQLASAIS